MLNSYTFLGDVVEIPSTIMFKMSERIFYRFFVFVWFLNFFRIWIVFQIWIDKSKFIHCSSTGRPVFPVTGFAPHNEFVPLKNVSLLLLVCFCLISVFHVETALFLSIKIYRLVFFINSSFCKWHDQLKNGCFDFIIRTQAFVKVFSYYLMN